MAKKGKVFFMAICFISCFMIASCREISMATVHLYDADRLFAVEYVSVGNEYDFEIPAKEGYIFLGWYDKKDEGNAYTDDRGKSAGKTWQEDSPNALYAHWEAKKYTITFDYRGATAFNSLSEMSVIYDAEIKELFPVPQKQGYSFIGWFTDETNGKQITDSSGNFVGQAKIYNSTCYPISDAGTTLYAHWGEKTVTYMFVTDGNSVEQQTYTMGSTVNDLPITIKDNYCFESWCFDATLLSPVKLPYTIPDYSEEYVTLYAKFVPASINILQFQTIAATGDREYEVSYEGEQDRIVIPDSYYGKSVTKVREIKSQSVRSILLPQTIREFDNAAFENCSALENVNIPRAVEFLPDRLFNGCTSLQEIELPQSVKTIGKEVFAACNSIEELFLPANINSIGAGTFRNMKALIRIDVEATNERYKSDEGVLYYKVGNSSYLIQYPAAKKGSTYTIDPSTVKIAEYAFSSALISSLNIGGKIASIETGAFENCEKLVNITISGSAVSFAMEGDAFLNCKNLKAMKIDLAKVPTIEPTTFGGVANTFSVYVTSNMVRSYQTANNWRNIASKIYSLGTIYGDFAIAEVEGGYTIRQYFGTEKIVTIPEILNAHKVIGISENAFSFSEMEQITISQSVSTIGDRAFSNCSNLKTIIVECQPPVLGENVFENIHSDYGIYVKNTLETLEKYRAAEKWSEMADRIWSYQ